ncbi:hypothetical protein [Kibdelosporangium philippinense]|uniref:hypothetical protein n=1 Tax=Kibdelosporangium philippinense TaxID=211113 RepID=UPI0036073237
MSVTDRLTVVLVTHGSTVIESWNGRDWDRADFYPGRVGMIVPGRTMRLRSGGVAPFTGSRRPAPNAVHQLAEKVNNPVRLILIP